MTVNVPRWLVGAAAIAFHTAHEGHPFRLTYMEHQIESPNYQKAIEKNEPRYTPLPEPVAVSNEPTQDEISRAEVAKVRERLAKGKLC